jgi:hypothetical protein
MTLDPTKWAGADDGPWVITPKDYGYELGVSSSVWIFELHDHRKPGDEVNDPEFIRSQDACAALIAAAPEIEAERVRLETENAKLREALEPFAALHDETMISYGDESFSGYPDDRHAWGFNRKDLTWGDFRSARAALGATDLPIDASKMEHDPVRDAVAAAEAEFLSPGPIKMPEGQCRSYPIPRIADKPK